MTYEIRACPKCNWTKWKTKLKDNYIQCLHCYKKYSIKQFKKIKPLKVLE